MQMARPLTLESTVIVRTSRALARWYRDEAARRGCRPADLYRMALAQYMGRALKKQGKPADAFEAAFVKPEAVR
jgi:hypothetical protein